MKEQLEGVQLITDEQGHKKAIIDLSALAGMSYILVKSSETGEWFQIGQGMTLERLPPDIEEALAELEDEQRWEALFAQSPDVLERLAEEARAEEVTGRTKELDPDTL